MSDRDFPETGFRMTLKVTDGNIITGRGPGWAVEFGLAILAHIKGQETADKVKAGLML